MFVQRKNSLTGEMEWEVELDHYDYHQEVARSAFADMLHDKERNQKYFIGLQRAINKMHMAGRKANVLDIGTGTGLLSMMAAKCGADQVIACETFRPMSECAVKIIKDNGYDHLIKVIPKRSNDLVIGENGDMLQKANILVSEVFDTELIGEGALETFIYAVTNLLENDCIIVPSEATVYCQIVESPAAIAWNKLCNVNDCTGKLLLEVPGCLQKCPGAASVHDIQLNQFPMSKFKTLVPPTPVLHFNWSKKKLLCKDRRNVQVCSVKRTGVAHCAFVWWDLKMDTDRDIVLSCAPFWAHPDVSNPSPDSSLKDSIPWRDHWMQAVYFFPHELTITAGEKVHLISSHDEFSLWFTVTKKLSPNADVVKRPACSCGFHVMHARTRLSQINDTQRMEKYLRLLKKYISPSTVCLCFSDSSFLGPIAAKLGAKKVYVYESNNFTNIFSKPIVYHNELENNVEFLENIEQLMATVDLSTVDLIIGEPYFSTSLYPWDNFYFLHLINQIRDKVTQAEILPRKAVLNVLAVEFVNLHKIRSPLRYCEGFDMKHFDDLIEESCNISDSPVEPQPLWEYPCRAAGKIIKIMELDFSKDSMEPLEVKIEADIENNMKCNGLVFWVDWYLDESEVNIVTTGPIASVTTGEEISWDSHTRQGVHLITTPRNYASNDIVAFIFKYDPYTCEVDFVFN